MIPAIVITVSDSRSAGVREDVSGPEVMRILSEASFEVSALSVADEQPLIEDALRQACERARLVVTTGGTGIAPRDVTPEATRAVCDRLVDGVAEQMRSAGLKETPFAVLSRGLCGARGRSLVLNLPGSPRGAVTSLSAVLHLLPHALQLLDGSASHDAPGSAEPVAR